MNRHEEAKIISYAINNWLDLTEHERKKIFQEVPNILSILEAQVINFNEKIAKIRGL